MDNFILGDGFRAQGRVEFGNFSCIGNNVTCGDGVIIGAQCVIGDNVRIGKGTVLLCGCVLEKNTIIGEGCLLENHVSISSGVKIGNNVFVGNNCVIGNRNAVGVTTQRILERIYCDIGDAVNVRANCTICGGVDKEHATVIAENVYVGEGCLIRRGSKIGEKTCLATMVFVAENATVGYNCFLSAHTIVGENSKVSAGTLTENRCIFRNDAEYPSKIYFYEKPLKDYALTCILSCPKLCSFKANAKRVMKEHPSVNEIKDYRLRVE